MTINGNANELNSFAVNCGELYLQRLLPTFKNLERKMVKGIYNPALAVKVFKYSADQAAKLYVAEYGGSFSVQDLTDCAELMRLDFECEINAGNSWLS